VEERLFRGDRLKQEIDALLTAGHMLGAWSAADTELTRDLELLDGAWQCTCACGLMLLAGWDANGAFTVVRGVGRAYCHEADPRSIEADLESRREGPCRAAQALASFHSSAGYRRFAECFNE
jgi:hypothetical protein